MIISEARFVVVDTESTGFEYEAGDRIVEFAGRFHPAGAELAMLVNPGRPIPATASAVHHLIDADVADALPLDEAMVEIRRFVDPGAVVVAHNAAFDRSMLPCIADRRWLCTQRLAMHLYPDAPAFKNQVLRYHLGGARLDLRGQVPHRAMADVLVTTFVLEELLRRYLIDHADDVDALIALAERPCLIKRMQFGKWAGTLVTDLPIDYIEWGLRSFKRAEDRDLYHTFRIEHARRRGASPEALAELGLDFGGAA